MPEVKCKKDDYKALLFKEIEKAAGTRPPLGGIEYTQEIVEHLDLAYVEQTEPSFEKMLKDLKGRFNHWRDQDEVGWRPT